MRLLVDRRMLMAVRACWPRMRSTTSLAFCGETRIYRASARASMAVSLLLLRLVRVTFEGSRRRELAELVPNHVFGDVHRNELLAVVDSDRVANEVRDD